MMIQKIMTEFENQYGAAMTYGAAAANAGVGAWVGENWFLILSAAAVLVRIGIDIPKLSRAWRKSDGQAPKRPDE